MKDNEKVKCDTLDNIEKFLPGFQQVFESQPESSLVGTKVVAPLVEAILTLSREVRELRESQ